jgi:hypothetical protein
MLRSNTNPSSFGTTKKRHVEGIVLCVFLVAIININIIIIIIITVGFGSPLLRIMVNIVNIVTVVVVVVVVILLRTVVVDDCPFSLSGTTFLTAGPKSPRPVPKSSSSYSLFASSSTTLVEASSSSTSHIVVVVVWSFIVLLLWLIQLLALWTTGLSTFLFGGEIGHFVFGNTTE